MDMSMKDEQQESIPRLAMMHVCMSIASDPEPLLSLSMRLRTLLNLAAVDRETREVVVALALPCLEDASVPSDDRARHKAAKRPTLARLAYVSDHKLFRLREVMCAAPSGWFMGAADGRRRATVDRILDAAERFWALIPLKAELRRRRSDLLTAKQARMQFRLRPADIAACAQLAVAAGMPGLGMRREDLLDAALRRHGSTAALERHDAAIRTSAERRCATAVLRAARREDLRTSSGLVQADWLQLMASRVDVVDLVRVFERKGVVPAREAALAVVALAAGELDARRTELRSLPWPPQAWLVRSAVTMARQEYIAFASESALATVHETSARWTHVLEVWAGASATESGFPAHVGWVIEAVLSHMAGGGPAGELERARERWDRMQATHRDKTTAHRSRKNGTAPTATQAPPMNTP
jgi:hypothetical protein